MKRQKKTLEKQKPKKRLRGRRFSFKSLFLAASILLITAATFYFGSWAYKNRLQLLRLLHHEPTNLEFSFQNPREFPQEKLQEINKFLHANINGKRSFDLTTITKTIQKKYFVERVNILQASESLLVITLIPRKPVLVVNADRPRLVTRYGEIYGRPDENSKALPLLTGVFAPEKNFGKWHDNNTLLLTVKEKTLVQEAVLLHQEASKAKIHFKKINYIPFRGFAAKTSVDDTEIYIGRAPFSGRLERLVNILLNLKKKGKVAIRIELDYNGKAFIKEKPL